LKDRRRTTDAAPSLRPGELKH